MSEEKHPLRAEKRKQFKKAASLPLGKRLLYYFDYFKFYIIGIPVAGFLIFLLVKALFFAPNTALYGYFVNAPVAMETEDDVFLQDFFTYAGIDETKENIYFSSDFSLAGADSATMSKFVSNLSLGEIDFFICDRKTLDELAKEDILINLAYYFDEATLQAHKARLFSYQEATGTESEEFAPIAVNITDSPILKESGAFAGAGEVYFCVAGNSRRKENTTLFLEWLLHPVRS